LSEAETLFQWKSPRNPIDVERNALSVPKDAKTRRILHPRTIASRALDCVILPPRATPSSFPRPAENRKPLTDNRRMPPTASFDVTTGVDLQEVDNAINQAQKEIAQRYDFKGSKASIEFKRAEGLIALVADSDFQMTALFDVVQTKLIKRGVSVKNLDIGELKQAAGDTVRRDVKLKMQLDGETAKKVAAAIKDAKLKKVQAAIQGEQVRVSGPSRDDLQEVIALLRSKDFGVELKFGNYR
jgi:cyclic-di-GMP-binding protein